MKKINLLFFGILLILIFFAIFVYAAQYYQVNSGAEVIIDEHGVCFKVKNNNAQAMFVPTNTAGEWTAFRNNAPGVSLSDCIVFDKISAGEYHTCGITSSGALWCWGYNVYGQLGDGTTTTSYAPRPVSGLTSGVSIVSAGRYHTCAVHNGATKCWGYNGNGQLGDGTTTTRLTPVQVSGLTSGVSSVSAVNSHTCAVHNGAAKCWGWNYYGQLGDGTTTQKLTPVQVSGLTSGVTSVSAGYLHTCAVHNGAAKCWGSNGNGRLGDGTITQRLTPVQVSGGLTSGVTSVSAGYLHTCAVHNGAAKCWGSNGNGRLGIGTTITQELTPVRVSGLGSGVSSVSAANSHTCAVHNGAAKCWGWNGNGRLGDGTTTQRLTPVQVSGLTSGVTSVSAGGSYTCSFGNSGTNGFKCWGYNWQSQLGDGTTTTRLTPVNPYPFISGSSCSQSGHTIFHGKGMIFYLYSHRSYSSDCDAYSQIRICLNGALSGSYTSATCTYDYYTSSCPFLFYKDGDEFVYETDISGGGLGTRSGKTPLFYERTNHIIPIKPDGNNIYELKLAESMDEISYVDDAKLIIVDHSADVEIVTTGIRDAMLSLTNEKIYTLSNPILPSLVLDKNGNDVTQSLLYRDDIVPNYDLYDENIFYVTFDNIEGNEHSKLILDLWSYIGTDKEIENSIFEEEDFYSSVSVLDLEGNWEVVYENFRSSGDFKTLTLELGNISLSENKTFKINIGRTKRLHHIVIDRIRYDESIPVNFSVQEIYPNYAYLEENQYHRHKIHNLNSSMQVQSTAIEIDLLSIPQYGNFTKLGDVLPLLLEGDDKFVIMRKGDALTLKFDAPEKLDEKRTVIFSSRTYYNVAKFGEKAGTFYTHPMPFREMTKFPYNPDEENYYKDETYVLYDNIWNTRIYNENLILNYFNLK